MTLVEMIFAAAISSLVVLGLSAAFLTHARAYRDQRNMKEMQQNVRFATDSVCRDIRMAGYGLSIRSSEMTKWLTWVGGMTRNPMVRQGSSVSAPDAVSIAAAFDLPAAYLSTASGAGSTSIVVGNGEGANFNATNKSVIYIGRCETARVVSRSGDVLTVSTHPSTAGRGLSFNYPAGSPVELVKVVTYRWCPATNTFPRQPYLVRDENLGGLSVSWHGMVAASIEDFQVAYDGYSVRVTIRGRTSAPLFGSRDPVAGDSFRRMTVSTRVVPRNSPVLMLRGAAGGN